MEGGLEAANAWVDADVVTRVYLGFGWFVKSTDFFGMVVCSSCFFELGV